MQKKKRSDSQSVKATSKQLKKSLVPIHEFFPRPIFAIIVRFSCSSRKGLRNCLFVCKYWYHSVLEFLEDLPANVTNIFPEGFFYRVFEDPLPNLLKFSNLKTLEVETQDISLLTQFSKLETLGVRQIVNKKRQGLSYDELFPIVRTLTRLNTLKFESPTFESPTARVEFTEFPQPHPSIKSIELEDGYIDPAWLSDIVTSLSFGKRVPAVIQEALYALSQLTSLQEERHLIHWETIQHLTNLRVLGKLNLQYLDAKDLCKLPNLESLSLIGTITNPEYLQNLTKLTALYIDDISSPSLEQYLPQLLELEYAGHNPPSSFAALANVTKLKFWPLGKYDYSVIPSGVIHLSVSPVRGIEYELHRLTRLTHLTLDGWGAVAHELLQVTTLKSLKLENDSRPSPFSITANDIVDFTQLEHLAIPMEDFDEKEMEILCTLTNLQSLRIEFEEDAFINFVIPEEKYRFWKARLPIERVDFFHSYHEPTSVDVDE
jgi:hypothetical protein